jgi:predicted DNA-binding transcriptional regulator AlpA
MPPATAVAAVPQSRTPRLIKPRPATPAELFDERQVCELTTLSPNTLDRMIKCGGFPRPLRLAKRLKRWRATDVRAWIANLPTDE